MKEFLLSNLDQEELEIVHKWPQFYIEPLNETDDKNTCNLRYGFEHQKGWLKLCDKLGKMATKLVNILKLSKEQSDARIVSCILKEKFGALENQGDDNLIEPYHELWTAYNSKIRNESLHTCEICGEYGKLYKKNYWLKTRCEKCYEEEEKI